jgi:hypothetical protein
MLRRTLALATVIAAAGCTQDQGGIDSHAGSAPAHPRPAPLAASGKPGAPIARGNLAPKSFLGDVFGDTIGVIVHTGDTIADHVADDADKLLGLDGHLSQGERNITSQANAALVGVREALGDNNPLAGFPAAPEFVDEVVQAMIPIVQDRALLADVLTAAVDARTDALTASAPDLLLYKDRITYNRSDLNGAPYNLSAGGPGALGLLVDRSQGATGWNRSVMHRFLGLVHDGRGVALCNKEGAVLHAQISLDGGQTYNEVPFPLDGSGAHECEIFYVDDVAKFYLRSIVGEARLHLRNDFLTSVTSPDVLQRSSGIEGVWQSNVGEDVRPMPKFLNRLVFFDTLHDGLNDASKNAKTGRLIRDLVGNHVPSAACDLRTIDDPLPAEPDSPADHKIQGLRTCQDGDWLDQRDGDTAFALETVGGFDALVPLVQAFVAHGAEDDLLNLLEVFYRYDENGGSSAEPAAAALISANFVPTLRALALAAEAAAVEGATGFGRIFQ